MSGVFVCVVGPSGAGKDTLIDGARHRLEGEKRIVFPKRVVTRPASCFEEHDSLSAEAFRELENAGGFALSWQAHGLGYGIPASVLGIVGEGRVAVCNLSRSAIGPARGVFPCVQVVEITAPAEVLQQRLAQRGREGAESRGTRLVRSLTAPLFRSDLVIENVGELEPHIDALVRFLKACEPRPQDDFPVGMLAR